MHYTYVCVHAKGGKNNVIYGLSIQLDMRVLMHDLVEKFKLFLIQC